MRLDKFLSDHTQLTRSLATKAIKQGRVFVNGVKAKTGAAKLDLNTDEVKFDHEPIQTQSAFRYYMMHKPKGVICANQDGEHALVFDLMSNEINPQRLHTVGRLDKDTTGLLLITDDGQWSHVITSPKHHQAKTYRAWLAQPLIETAEARVQQGIVLNDDVKPTLPGILKRISDTEILLTINEGRYHQVKRMMGALGNRVVDLHREKIGAITLDESLKPGEYRPLTQTEIESLQTLKG